MRVLCDWSVSVRCLRSDGRDPGLIVSTIDRTSAYEPRDCLSARKVTALVFHIYRGLDPAEWRCCTVSTLVWSKGAPTIPKATGDLQQQRIGAFADLLKSLRKMRSGSRKLRRPTENV